MSNDWEIETHPNWYKDIPVMRALLLGNFPPHPEKWQYPFFYPNGQNRFWKILADLAGENLKWTKTDKQKAVEERYEIMKKLEIGVQNIGLEVERRDRSALDTNIRITKYQDLGSIFEKHPELSTIFLAGYSAAHSTAKSFINYIKLNGIKHSSIGQLKSELSFKIFYGVRSIECIVLNSTSTAAKIKYDLLLDQYRRNLKY